MVLFSLGLAKVSVPFCMSTLCRPAAHRSVPGLVHAEFLSTMQLGSPILSRGRMNFSNLVMFAMWESEDALEEYLNTSKHGHAILQGWHLRMTFLRRWGAVRELASLPETLGESDPQEPVAAFTLARMKILEVPRFISWGRPVEALVRDDPQASFALAAIRYPNSIGTFTIWNSQQAMRDMVNGRSNADDSARHLVAMKERTRRDFHHEFTTLRFRPISEFGSWEGRATLLPTNCNV